MSNLSYSEAWLAGPNFTQFYTRTYTPEPPVSTKAVIVFVHGFAEHVGRYSHFHPLLSSRGIAVFTYDQRGFGLTAQDTEGKKSKSSAYGKTCWKDQMADIEWAVEHTRKSFEGKPVFLMGHSMVNFTTTPDSEFLVLILYSGWWRGIRIRYARRKRCSSCSPLFTRWGYRDEPSHRANQPSLQSREMGRWQNQQCHALHPHPSPCKCRGLFVNLCLHPLINVDWIFSTCLMMLNLTRRIWQIRSLNPLDP